MELERGRARVTVDEERARAFDDLVTRHLARAYRLAGVLLGSEADAQDAVQDAAAAAWARFSDLRDAAAFDAWFDRILVNGCRDRLRARGRSRGRVVAIDMTDAEGHGADGLGRLDALRVTGDPSVGLAEREALRSALAGLSPEQRVSVVLRYYGDMSLEEIAERTGERLGTVKSRLHYGISALRAAYDAAARLPGETRR